MGVQTFVRPKNHMIVLSLLLTLFQSVIPYVEMESLSLNNVMIFRILLMTDV